MCKAITLKGDKCKLAPTEEFCHIHKNKGQNDIGGAYSSKAEKKYINPIICCDRHLIGSYDTPQHHIPGVGDVDGFCPICNTVYEFHGDYWHGNPNIHDQRKYNYNKAKTFGQLFSETIERDVSILNKGFNLEIQWETDYPEYYKILKMLVR